MFTVPVSDADKPENRYEFQIGEKTYSVPLMSHLDGETIEALENMSDTATGEMASRFRLFGAAGTEVGNAVRTLDARQINALYADYRKASGISVGESSASDAS